MHLTVFYDSLLSFHQSAPPLPTIVNPLLRQHIAYDSCNSSNSSRREPDHHQGDQQQHIVSTLEQCKCEFHHGDRRSRGCWDHWRILVFGTCSSVLVLVVVVVVDPSGCCCDVAAANMGRAPDSLASTSERAHSSRAAPVPGTWLRQSATQFLPCIQPTRDRNSSLARTRSLSLALSRTLSLLLARAAWGSVRLVNFVCSQSGDNPLERFSQIWLQEKYKSKIL